MSATTRILAAAAAVLMLGSVAAGAQETVIAKVNGKTITEADMRLAEAEIGSDLGSLPDVTKRRVLVEFLIENQLFADAAEAQKLGTGRRLQRAHAVLAAALPARPLLRQDREGHGQRRGSQEILRRARSAARSPRRGARPPHPGREQGKGARAVREDRLRHRLRRAGQAELQGPGQQGPGRRSRLLLARARWCRSSRRPPSSCRRAR